MTTTIERLWQTDAEYYADTTHVSMSALDCFRQSSRLYFGRYVANTIPHPEPTEAMAFGTAFHRTILEPERFAAEYVLAPECDRRTKAGKAAWEAFQEGEGKGKAIISQEDFDALFAMRRNVEANDLAAFMLANTGDIEKPIAWEDPIGIRCKCKPDKLFPQGSVILDLKSAADPGPEAFRKSVANLGYHRRAAWYLDGVERETGMACQFLFLVVGKEPPYDVAIYELDSDSLLQGRRENSELLQRLKACQATGQWANPWAKDIQTLSLPRWAMSY